LSKTDQDKVLDKLDILVENPSHPSLRTKKMKDGSGKYEMSVNMDIRVLWRFDRNNAGNIIVFDVGHHDVLKK